MKLTMFMMKSHPNNNRNWNKSKQKSNHHHSHHLQLHHHHLSKIRSLKPTFPPENRVKPNRRLISTKPSISRGSCLSCHHLVIFLMLIPIYQLASFSSPTYTLLVAMVSYTPWNHHFAAPTWKAAPGVTGSKLDMESWLKGQTSQVKQPGSLTFHWNIGWFIGFRNIGWL